MKHLKVFGLAAVAAMALTAFAGGSASATTLEVNGATTNSTVAIQTYLPGGSGLTWLGTNGSVLNFCESSFVSGGTRSPFTGSKVTGSISSMAFVSCTRPVTVHKPGQFYVEHIAGTTDGTVFSENTEVTVGTVFGTINCKTGEGTDIGRLTGSSSGTAVLHIVGVLKCGFLMPSAIWGGTYDVVGPAASGLGVSA